MHDQTQPNQPPAELTQGFWQAWHERKRAIHRGWRTYSCRGDVICWSASMTASLPQAPSCARCNGAGNASWALM
jgi:hypothetical protein